MMGIEYSFQTDRQPPQRRSSSNRLGPSHGCHTPPPVTHIPPPLSHELLSVVPRTCRGCCMLPASLPPCHPTPFPQSKLGWVKRGQASGGICDLPQHSWGALVPLPLRHFPAPGPARGWAELKKSLPLTVSAWDSMGPGVLRTPPTTTPSASMSPKAPSCPSRLSLHLGAGVGEAKRDCLLYS